MFGSIATQAQTLINLTKKKKKTSKTKLLTITSGKGGVGKSTLAANIAYVLSTRGYKVAVMDADIGLANLQVIFNMKPAYTMFDYIEGKIKIEDMLSPTPYKNITLIAGKSGYEYSKTKNSFIFTRIVYDILSLDFYDILLVDTGAGLNDNVKEFLEISSNVLAITTPDPSALTDVYAIIKMLANRKDRLMLCFNHTERYKVGETISASLLNLAIKNRLNANFMVQYVGNIPSSAHISTTGRLKKLFAKEFGGEPLYFELDTVVNKIVENLDIG